MNKRKRQKGQALIESGLVISTYCNACLTIGRLFELAELPPVAPASEGHSSVEGIETPRKLFIN